MNLLILKFQIKKSINRKIYDTFLKIKLHLKVKLTFQQPTEEDPDEGVRDLVETTLKLMVWFSNLIVNVRSKIMIAQLIYAFVLLVIDYLIKLIVRPNQLMILSSFGIYKEPTKDYFSILNKSHKVSSYYIWTI